MAYALLTLWHERNRYLPGVLAVAFSAVLIVLQFGLLLGIFSVVSIAIDRSGADIWISYPNVSSVGTTLPVPAAWESRLASQPEIERVELYVRGMALLAKRRGGVEICQVIGSRLDADSLGAVSALSPELRRRLAEPGSVAVDEEEMAELGLEGVGDYAEVNGCHVKVVATIRHFRAFAGTYLFCSLSTARNILHLPEDQTTYLLARCRSPADAPAVVQSLRRYPGMAAFTSKEFALKSQLHWITKTKAGAALGCAAFLGLLVGASVTSQTLYAAVSTSLRQYAVLEALGIPGRQMAAMVLCQAFWVGILGVGLATPVVFVLGRLMATFGARMLFPPWLLGSAAALTLGTALLSGLLALRSLRLADPAALLR